MTSNNSESNVRWNITLVNLGKVATGIVITGAMAYAFKYTWNYYQNSKDTALQNTVIKTIDEL
jgi:hypothetical protein